MTKLFTIALIFSATTSLAQCENGRCVRDGWSAPRINVPRVAPHPAACRIVNSVAGSMNYGSGTLVAIGEAKFVLTCEHIFREGQGSIRVEFPDNRRLAAKVVAIDQANDLAALSIGASGVSHVAIGSDIGGTLRACGYGKSGHFACAMGPVVGYSTPQGAALPSMKIAAGVRQGDSGGGVLNSRDQLVGVVWGVRGGTTFATFGKPLREFVDGVRNRLNPPLVKVKPSKPNEWVPGVEGHRAPNRSANGTPSVAPADGSQDSVPATRPDDWTVQLDDRIARIEALIANRKGFLEGASLTKIIAAALGLSGPMSAALVIGSIILRRRIRRKSKKRRHWFRPIAIDTPPPPQQTVPETHYVPYERDSFAKAYQWASEQVSRKYPGSIETLTALDSLIKQQVNAE